MGEETKQQIEKHGRNTLLPRILPELSRGDPPEHRKNGDSAREGRICERNGSGAKTAATGGIAAMTDRMRREIGGIGREMTDAEVMELLEQRLLLSEELKFAGFKKKKKILETIFLSIRKELSVLDPYLKDPEINEIMVNGKDRIFIEKNGTIRPVETAFPSTEELEEVIRRIAARVHREINEMNPILDARLADGARVNAVYKNVAVDGPVLTIRRFPEKEIGMEELIRRETINREAAAFLKELVEAGYNLFISGGTSSGKTTFLNALSGFIPKEERVIVIEDSAELRIQGISNLVRMECRSSNSQGKGQVDMKQLIKASLRMRPNRIIVGEVRGAEVVDMIQAMNTGHDGSLSTGHGNSPEGMISRLEAMFLQAADFPVEAIRRQIAEGIDILIHLGRLSDRKRVVYSISELAGMENGAILLNELYSYDWEKGLIPTGNALIHTRKLKRRRHHD